MSGGSHDYAYRKLEDVADSFYREHQPDEHELSRKKVADILRHMAKICHEIEWIDSCDYGKNNWIEVEKMLEEITIK